MELRGEAVAEPGPITEVFTMPAAARDRIFLSMKKVWD